MHGDTEEQSCPFAALPPCGRQNTRSHTSGTSREELEELVRLARAIVDGNAILFVGAGVSMHVGLPSWRALTEHMADEVGLDRNHLSIPEVHYQMVAEYYRLQGGSMEMLGYWLRESLTVCKDLVAKSTAHEMLVNLGFPIIYTTNYDRNLEAAYELHRRPYAKITNARDLANLVDGITQIVKFHGDLDDPESLVLTESDHFERLSFETPLDVKLRSDALGKTILFIGYSVSDMNIRLLLYRLWQTWNQSGFAHDRPPSFIFMPGENKVQEKVLRHWGISVLHDSADAPGAALINFLRRLSEEVSRLRSSRPEMRGRGS